MGAIHGHAGLLLASVGGGGATYAGWDATAHGGGITISGAGRVATGSGSVGVGIARGDRSIGADAYFEVSFVPNVDNVGVGVCTTAVNLGNYLGQEAAGAGYYLPSADVYIAAAAAYNGSSDATTPAVVGIAFKPSTREGWVRRADGTGWEGGGDPTTGTSPTFTMAAGTYYPACTPYTAGNGECTINAGQDPFVLWTPSGGFAGIT
jgi:hypothetical protein